MDRLIGLVYYYYLTIRQSHKTCEWNYKAPNDWLIHIVYVVSMIAGQLFDLINV